LFAANIEIDLRRGDTAVDYESERQLHSATVYAPTCVIAEWLAADRADDPLDSAR
jgi:hypothetical protein